jgi:O-antigen/teichoic acid export membrane protein
MRRQLIWTFAAELAVMGASMVVLRAAAQVLGPQGFGEYTLCRRVIGLLQLPLMLGLGIATPRYLAIATARPDHREQRAHYVLAGVGCALIVTLVVAVGFALVPRLVATFFFGSQEFAVLVRPAMLALVGFAAHSVLYAVLRGQLRMRAANAFQFVNLGVVPIAVFALAPSKAEAVIAWLGSLWFALAGAGLVWAVGALVRGSPVRAASLVLRARELLTFGLPRVPGEFALVALFSLPTIVVAHTTGIVQAGHLSFALSVLTMIGSAFAPIGQILLPRASAQVATGKVSRVRHDVVRLLAIGMGLVSVGVLLAEIVARPTVLWYLGPSYAPVVAVLRWILAGAIPYVAYVLLRNVLDALSVRPMNSRNLVAALATVTVLAVLRHDALGLAVSLTAGLTLLGGLTWRDTRRLLWTPRTPTTALPPSASTSGLRASATEL